MATSQGTIGRRIRKLRTQAHLSQEQLSDGICTAAYISHVEGGKRRPSGAMVERIAERLGTTAEHLLTGKSPHHEARVRLDIDRARASVIRGEAEAGLEQAHSLRDEARANAFAITEGKAEEIIGRALLGLGRRPEALEAFRRSQELLEREGVEARVPAVVGGARALFHMGDVHQAIYELETCLIELNRRPEVDPDAALQLYGALIGPCFEAGLLDKAREAAHEVERLEVRVSDPENRACGHINLAGMYLSEDRFEEALAAMGKAEMLFLQVDAVGDAAKVGIAQAHVFIERGRWEDARMRLKEALSRLADTPPGLDHARLLIQLGRVDRLSGNPGKATTHLQEALEVLEHAQHNERGLAQREFGLCALAEGDRESGTRLLHEAIASYRAASNPVQVGLTYLLLGDAIPDDSDDKAHLYREGLEEATRTAI